MLYCNSVYPNVYCVWGKAMKLIKLFKLACSFILISYLFSAVLVASEKTAIANKLANSKQVNKKASAKSQAEVKASTVKPTKKLKKSQFKTIEWTELMPKEDLDALLNPPEYIANIEEGSVDDQISQQVENSIAAAGDDDYQKALVSTRIKPEMNGKAIRIPGFVVPVEFDDNQVISKFFLVPFFGACIHVPPPPPNQIIFVNSPKGIKLKALYDPFWVSGVLRTSLVENAVATAAYTMDMQYFEPYTE